MRPTYGGGNSITGENSHSNRKEKMKKIIPGQMQQGKLALAGSLQCLQTKLMRRGETLHIQTLRKEHAPIQTCWREPL